MRRFAPDGPPAARPSTTRSGALRSACGGPDPSSRAARAAAAGRARKEDRHDEPSTSPGGPLTRSRPRGGAAQPGGLERLLRFFVAPPAPATPAPAELTPSSDPRPQVPITPGSPPARTTTAAAPRVVVLGAAADVAAVARAAALRLTAAPRAAGVVATWSPAAAGEERPPAPAVTPPRAGAACLAASLCDGGHAARAGGRLVHVRLEAGPAAVAEAERLQDAAGDVPVVIALGGARGSEWDDLLAEQDLVLLAVGPGVPPALAAVALARAQDLCGPVPAHAVTVGGGRRPRPSREQLSAALERLAAG